MTDTTYPKASRLLKPDEFKWVFDKPYVKVHSSHLLMFARVNEDSNQARLGLAITKKKVPTAVARNRLKRITREQFRLAQNLPHVDMVLIVKKPITYLSNAELHEEVQSILYKLKRKVNKADGSSKS